MGLVLVDKVAKFNIADAIGVVLPVNEGLKALAFFGDSTAKNKMLNGEQFTKVGNPTKLSELISICNETAFVKTSQPLTESGTMIAVFRAYDPQFNNTVAGWYPNENGQAGISIINTTEGKLLGFAQLVNKTNVIDKTTLTAQIEIGSSVGTSIESGKWLCVAVRWGLNVNNAVELKINNLTYDAIIASTANSNYKISTDTNFQPFAVGSGYTQNTEGSGSKMIAFSCYYDHSLSDVDLLKMHKYLKTLLQDQDIEI